MISLFLAGTAEYLNNSKITVFVEKDNHCRHVKVNHFTFNVKQQVVKLF